MSVGVQVLYIDAYPRVAHDCFSHTGVATIRRLPPPTPKRVESTASSSWRSGEPIGGARYSGSGTPSASETVRGDAMHATWRPNTAACSLSNTSVSSGGSSVSSWASRMSHGGGAASERSRA
eukprot:702782-Prymnesium_polylepis.1